MKICNQFTAIRIKARELCNPFLGKIRRKFLLYKDFTIISNNCWGGHVYRYFSMSYNSPTVGLYFFSEDYVRFVLNFKHYMDLELNMISISDSKWHNELIGSSAMSKNAPIGKLGDIEIIFLHYSTPEEALEKWNRRKSRICWDHLYFKMSEQNLCNVDLLKQFDGSPWKNKIIFTTKDYGLKSQIIFGDYYRQERIFNDTNNFRKYINLINWINEKPCKKRQK